MPTPISDPTCLILVNKDAQMKTRKSIGLILALTEIVGAAVVVLALIVCTIGSIVESLVSVLG